MKGNIKIRQYMLQNIEDSIDPITGEVNYTNLALDACTHFNDFEGDEVPEKYYDCAVDVATRYEIKTGVIHGSARAISRIINSLDSSWF